LGGVGTGCCSRTDRVRIWSCASAPARRATYQHDLDHILVLVSGDRIAVEPEAGHGGPYKQFLEAEVVPGSAVYVPRGGIETAVQTRARAIRSRSSSS